MAVNPATGEEMPVWVADYVLGGYGSGAIMAVPAHDARDHEFAEAFGLPIRAVVAPAEESATSPTANGSGPFAGRTLFFGSCWPDDLLCLRMCWMAFVKETFVKETNVMSRLY